jgi:hypothetical protein
MGVLRWILWRRRQQPLGRLAARWARFASWSDMRGDQRVLDWVPGPGVLRVRDRKPSADQRSGRVRDEVTTMSVVVETPGAHRDRRSTSTMSVVVETPGAHRDRRSPSKASVATPQRARSLASRRHVWQRPTEASHRHAQTYRSPGARPRHARLAILTSENQMENLVVFTAGAGTEDAARLPVPSVIGTQDFQTDPVGQ